MGVSTSTQSSALSRIGSTQHIAVRRNEPSWLSVGCKHYTTVAMQLQAFAQVAMPTRTLVYETTVSLATSLLWDALVQEVVVQLNT